MALPLPIRTADLPADAPRWADRNGSVWVEIEGDHLVLAEHAGQPVPIADPIPRATVTRQHGELTTVGEPVVQPETAEAVIARLRKSNVEHAIRANRAEKSHQRALTERNSNRMEADRIAAEMYRVRNALGVGPGGADLGLQVRNVLAERDVENTRLREQVAAWQAYAADLAENLDIIGPLAWTGIDKGADVLQDIYDRATVPALPEVLRDPATEA